MKTIFIIENSNFDQNYLSRILGRLGYRCDAAPTFDDARETVARQAPDLMLLGNGDSGPNSLETAREVQAHPSTARVPIVYLSSDLSPGTRERALEAGVADYITKPISIRQLYNSIERHVGDSRRMHIRAPMTFAVSVDHQSERLNLETESFGEGGMYLKTDSPLASGSAVEM